MGFLYGGDPHLASDTISLEQESRCRKKLGSLNITKAVMQKKAGFILNSSRA